MFKKVQEIIRKALLWSQKYTRTDMLYLAKGGFWLTFGDVIASGLAFVLAITFAHFVSKETYGTYQYIISIIGLLGILSINSGLSTSLRRSIAQGKEGSFVPTIKTAVRWALLGAAGAVAVSLYYFTKANSLLGWVFLLVAIFIPFRDSFSLYQSVLEGRKQFDTEVKYSIVTNIVSTLILILAAIFARNIFILILAYLIPRILFSLFFYLKLAGTIHSNAKEDSETVNFGMHLSFLRVLGMIAEKLDTILLWNLLGAPSVALYSFALGPVDQIRSVTNIIPTLASPKLAQNTTENLRKTLPRKIFVMVGILATITAVYIAAAPFIYRVFFPNYVGSIWYSQFYALSLLFVPRNVISETLAAHGQKGKMYALSMITSSFRIAIMIPLIHSFGVSGAVTAYLAASLFGFTFANILLTKI